MKTSALSLFHLSCLLGGVLAAPAAERREKAASAGSGAIGLNTGVVPFGAGPEFPPGGTATLGVGVPIVTEPSKSGHKPKPGKRHQGSAKKRDGNTDASEAASNSQDSTSTTNPMTNAAALAGLDDLVSKATAQMSEIELAMKAATTVTLAKAAIPDILLKLDALYDLLKTLPIYIASIAGFADGAIAASLLNGEAVSGLIKGAATSGFVSGAAASSVANSATTTSQTASGVSQVSTLLSSLASLYRSAIANGPISAAAGTSNPVASVVSSILGTVGSALAGTTTASAASSAASSVTGLITPVTSSNGLS